VQIRSRGIKTRLDSQGAIFRKTLDKVGANVKVNDPSTQDLDLALSRKHGGDFVEHGAKRKHCENYGTISITRRRRPCHPKWQRFGSG
jgi:hypothetical protein